MKPSTLKEGCVKVARWLLTFVSLWGKHLHIWLKKTVTEERIKGVFLLGDKKQQCISEYVDDSLFMIRGVKKDINEMIRILKIFSESSGMEID